MKKDPETKVTVFLMADFVIAGKGGQRTPGLSRDNFEAIARRES
jgi:hypothetical protein